MHILLRALKSALPHSFTGHSLKWCLQECAKSAVSALCHPHAMHRIIPWSARTLNLNMNNFWIKARNERKMRHSGRNAWNCSGEQAASLSFQCSLLQVLLQNSPGKQLPLDCNAPCCSSCCRTICVQYRLNPLLLHGLKCSQLLNTDWTLSSQPAGEEKYTY